LLPTNIITHLRLMNNQTGALSWGGLQRVGVLVLFAVGILFSFAYMFQGGTISKPSTDVVTVEESTEELVAAQAVEETAVEVTVYKIELPEVEVAAPVVVVVATTSATTSPNENVIIGQNNVVVQPPETDDTESVDTDLVIKIDEPTQLAVLSTDKDDYQPGEKVTIFGKLFESLSSVVVRIFGNSEVGNHFSDVSLDVNANEAGSFTLPYTLDNFYRPFYNVTASTRDGVELAAMTFADAAGAGIDDYSQCSNDDGDGYATGNTGCRWTNGNLNSNNSTYQEDDATVQRLLISGLAQGSHTVVLQYGTTKGGKHAYDFLTDDTYSETVTNADFCEGLTDFASCSTLTPVQSNLIPADTNASGHDTARTQRHFKVRNATNVSVGTPALVSGSYGSDSETSVAVTFNVDTNTCADSKTTGGVKTCPVLITWGAHVSTQADWGSGSSAVNISGSPYHVAISELDGASAGQRDNQMQASAIVVRGNLVVQKTTIPAGDPTSFTINTTSSNGGVITGGGAGTVSDANDHTYEVTPGTYSVAETVPTGWTKTADTCQNVAVGEGETKTCTITNTKKGSIIVEKQTNPNGAAGSFTFTGTAAGSISDNGQIVVNNLVPGTYTSTETNPSPLFSLTSIVCDDGASATPSTVNVGTRTATFKVDPGETVKCVFTNTIEEAHLTLVKSVVNNNGGTAAASAWTLGATGPTPISGTTGSAPVTNASVNSGTYTLSETGGPAGYAASQYSCVKNGGAPVVSNSITLSTGDNATCTITNDDQPGTLIVRKVVVNDNGGTATASNFSFQVNGGSAVSFESDGENSLTVNAGTYSVTEPSVSGYATTYNNCSNVIIPNGGTATCTVTNDDIAPTLTLVKTVINDNGGTATSSDFQGRIDGNNVAWKVAVPVAAGDHVASEVGLPGYVASAWGGDCEPNGSVKLILGQNKTCTITNDDIAPRLTVTKIVVNDNGGTRTVINFPLFVGATSVVSGVQNSFNAGSYVVSETSDPAYTSTISGDCASNGSVTLALGDVKACTITNDDIAPRLTVIKHVINDNGGTKLASDFVMNVTGTNVSNPVFAGSETGTALTLNAGAYSAAEVNLPGYTASSSSQCAGTIAIGETRTCTITNDDQPGTLIVRKVVINDNGGTATAPSFSFEVNGGSTVTFESDGENSLIVDAGTYTVTEPTVTGYATTYNSCANVVVANGGTATCTIINDDIAPRLTVTKVVINDNGGTLVASAVPLFVGTTGVTTGVQNTFNAGTYTVSETAQAGYAATISGDCSTSGTVTLGIGDVKACTITNNDIPATITIIKDAQANDLKDFSFGGSLGAFQLDDDSGVVEADDVLSNTRTFSNLSAGAYAVTEASESYWLQKGATCVVNGTQASHPSVFTAGTLSLSVGIGQNVTCTFVNEKTNPTRTQGFWQNHTAFTSSIFASPAMQKFIGVNLPVTTGQSKGVITNTQTAGASQLFGAFFSGISQKSTGKGKDAKRSDIDQARMQLLQQLVTAKLNCTAFGCTSSVGTLIAGADNAYRLGTSTASVRSYAGALDAYNNSGDTLIINTLPSPGKATPQTSRSYANISFWDQP
jgi:hypothetical protein